MHVTSKQWFLYFVPVCFFLFNSKLFSQSGGDASAVFILKGNTVVLSGKSIEGVEMDLKKNGQTVSKITSGKNGKYYIQMDISTTNPKHEYTLNISYAGTIPKLLSINAYIPPEEFSKFEVPRYEFSLEIVMIETSVKDIVLEKPSGKIKWDNSVHRFEFDQVYAKVAQKEQDKMKDENYLRELAAKKKKEEEEEARRKADEEAKLKADQEAKLKAEEEAKRLAELKAREEADKILQQNLDAMKQQMAKQRIVDSLAEIERKKKLQEANTKVEIQEFVKPVSPNDVDENAFDGTDAYNINIAKRSLKAQEERLKKEKAKNLSAKYETNNTLTSLLNMVDEHDKKLKKQ